MILNLLVDKKMTLSQLKETYTQYHIVKESIKVDNDDVVKEHINKIKNLYLDERINEVDGLKIDFKDSWVHIRSSNTEPIIRIIAEATTPEKAQKLVDNFLNIINE